MQMITRFDAPISQPAEGFSRQQQQGEYHVTI